MSRHITSSQKTIIEDRFNLNIQLATKVSLNWLKSCNLQNSVRKQKQLKSIVIVDSAVSVDRNWDESADFPGELPYPTEDSEHLGPCYQTRLACRVAVAAAALASCLRDFLLPC